ncbi:MAG: flippase-like domain-containing protein [Hahellaceae bacterium]|nr:flippase-like domain-containing protein [Hahellaceae bacterium]
MRMPTFGKMLRFIITIGLLVFVFWQSGLFSAEGRRHFLELIAQADLVFLVASFVMPSCLDFVSSVKWFLLAKGIQIEARIGQLFAYYLMGRFFNLVLPSNIGGDIIRIHLHGKKSGKRAQSAAAVFMERFTGLVALLLIVLVVAVVQSTSIDIPFMGVAILFTAVVTLVAASGDCR